MSETLSANAVKLLNDIRKGVEKKGINTDAVVAQLRDLRQHYIDCKDPLVTRVVRLTADYIEENETFNLNLLADVPVDADMIDDPEAEAEDPEVELYIDTEAEDSFSLMKENFFFLLDLFINHDKKANREDLQRIKQIYLDMGMV